MNSLCLVCQVGEETQEHAIWTCPFSSISLEKMRLNFQSFEGLSTSHILASIFENWTNKDFELFSMVS